MTFNEATDRAMQLGVTLGDLAEAMGLSRATIQAARLPPDSDGYRPPPDGWAPALRGILVERGKAMTDLARALPKV